MNAEKKRAEDDKVRYEGRAAEASAEAGMLQTELERIKAEKKRQDEASKKLNELLEEQDGVIEQLALDKRRQEEAGQDHPFFYYLFLSFP